MEALHGLYSPQLRLLAQELQTGNTTALIRFWQQIGQRGTPLIEPQNDQQFLVTLLWRDRKEPVGTLQCSLGGILNSRRMAPELEHLEGTDLWYKSYRLPDNVSATYHFFVNGTPTPDPLCPRTFVVPPDDVSPFGEHETRLAIVELPNAMSQPWLEQRAETRRGQFSTQLLHSALVGHDYRLCVYTPHNYQPGGEAYPLLLLYDAWTYTQVIPTQTILDNMIAAGILPPIIAVLFGHNKREERMREMAFYQPFFQCVMQELLPYIEQHYHISSDPMKTIVAGASMGGIAAVYSGLCYPERFGNILSHTGSFQAGPPQDKAFERIERMLHKHTSMHMRPSQRFYLDVGALERDEMGFGMPDGGPNALMSNRAMQALLHAKGYAVTYWEYPGGHDLLWAPATLAAGLQALLSP